MALKKVRVANPNNSMVITSTGVTIAGKYPKEVEATPAVLKAIGSGRLVEVSDEEYTKLMNEKNGVVETNVETKPEEPKTEKDEVKTEKPAKAEKTESPAKGEDGKGGKGGENS